LQKEREKGAPGSKKLAVYILYTKGGEKFSQKRERKKNKSGYGQKGKEKGKGKLMSAARPLNTIHIQKKRSHS